MIFTLVAMAIIVFGLSVWFWLYFESSQARLRHLQGEVSLALSGNDNLAAHNVTLQQDLRKLREDLEDMTSSREGHIARAIELESEVKRKQERIESLNVYIQGLEETLENTKDLHRSAREKLQEMAVLSSRPTCREARTTRTSKNKSESALWLEFRRAENSTIEYIRLPHSRFKDGQTSALANWADNPFPTCRKDGK